MLYRVETTVAQEVEEKIKNDIVLTLWIKPGMNQMKIAFCCLGCKPD